MTVHVLSAPERQQLRRLVDAQGLSAVAKSLDCSRGVVSSAVAGIGVRKGSLEQLKAALSTMGASK